MRRVTSVITENNQNNLDVIWNTTSSFLLFIFDTMNCIFFRMKVLHDMIDSSKYFEDSLLCFLSTDGLEPITCFYTITYNLGSYLILQE